MIKKERCKICGKKLVNGFCSECGLQQSDSKASTEDLEIDKPEKKRKTSRAVWGGVCILLILLPSLLNTPPFLSLIFYVQELQVVTSISESVYENASRELASDGVLMEVTLAEGNYIVGIDIPEGIYKASVVSRIASIDLKDQSNQIDFYALLHQESYKDSSYLENVRLYQGSILRIRTGEISFTSSNAQVNMLQELPQNENLQTYYVGGGEIAGIDFPEGTYDITVCGGERGMVDVSFNDRNKDALGFSDIMENEENALIKENALTCFRNVEFPKGTLIEITDVEIALVPSVRNSLVHR